MNNKTVETPISFKKPILAVGGQLKNTFCFALRNRIFISEIIGDLENIETLSVFEKSINDFQRRLKIRPKIIACDLHPEYLSTKYAQDIVNSSSSKLIQVQHHHAHIASCMADNNLKNQKVIGVAFDGTGFGSDFNLWGGEFLVADYKDFNRQVFFDYMPLAGGEQAIKEPWRMAAIYLHRAFGDDFLKLNIDFVKRLDKGKWKILKKMIEAGINAPLTSSVGRLFDAVSSLIGIRDEIEYEGQAAIELEKAIAEKLKPIGTYHYKINQNKGALIINVLPLIKGTVEDLKKNKSKGFIALKFHSTIVQIIVDVCKKIKDKTGIKTVALSGGVFLNKYISYNATRALSASGFKVITHKRVPCSDAGICLGQAVVANYKS